MVHSTPYSRRSIKLQMQYLEDGGSIVQIPHVGLRTGGFSSDVGLGASSDPAACVTRVRVYTCRHFRARVAASCAGWRRRPGFLIRKPYTEGCRVSIHARRGPQHVPAPLAISRYLLVWRVARWDRRAYTIRHRRNTLIIGVEYQLY